MKDVIFIRGPQGSGKTTIGKILRKHLHFSPYFEFDWIRGYHLDPQWKRASAGEENMSFQNVLFTIKNYLKKKYNNIILIGLEDDLRNELIQKAKIKKYVLVTLTIDSDKELRRRVLTESRDSGFRGVEESLKINRILKRSRLLKNEIKIDNSHNDPNITCQKIIKLVNS